MTAISTALESVALTDHTLDLIITTLVIQMLPTTILITLAQVQPSMS